MGNGCSVDHEANGGHVERKARNMDSKSPVFIGQMASQYGGGGNNAPQDHCPGPPSTVPTPPCGGRTKNCEAKGEAQRLQDRPETVTCNVTEYELTCKWEPRVVPKQCTVMVPQYKAVCAGQKKLMTTVQQRYQVDAKFDTNNDGVIQQNEYDAARAGGGLTAMGDARIVGMNGGGGGGAGFAAGGAAAGGLAAGGAQMGGAQMGGAQMMGGGMGGGYGGGAGAGGAFGGAQMGGGAVQMGGGGAMSGGAVQMGGGAIGGAMGGGAPLLQMGADGRLQYNGGAQMGGAMGGGGGYN